jgi:hypothetical protein
MIPPEGKPVEAAGEALHTEEGVLYMGEGLSHFRSGRFGQESEAGGGIFRNPHRMAGAEDIMKRRGERTIVLDYYRTFERKNQDPTQPGCYATGAEGGDIKRLDEEILAVP